MKDPTTDPRDIWSLDREIVLTRVVDAPRDLVFSVWTDATHLAAWFGPTGFITETLEADIRVGGRWRFNFTSPDGTLYSNRMVFRRIDPPHLIEMDHGSDLDDDPARFRVTVTFDAQSNGKTVVSLRQLHPTVAQRAGAIAFGAVEYGGQTMDKLAAYVAARR